MAQTKRKKPHRCKNHSRRAARGRCPKCRKWICRECAVLHNGKFYCKDTCLPEGVSEKPVRAKTGTKARTKKPTKARTKPITEPKKKKPAKIKKKVTVKKSPIKSVAFWSVLTVGLFGIVFGLIEMKRNWELQDKVQMYKESRRRLIDLVKKRNALIRKFKEEKKTTKQAKRQEKKVSKHAKVTWDYVQPVYNYSPERMPATFDNGTSSARLIALTFDGGAYPNVAEAILDTLKSRDVMTTMFLTGGFIRRNPNLVRKIMAYGHEVGNHTATHPHLTSWATTRSHTTLLNITREVIGRELNLANKYFKKLTGLDMIPLWRAPYGEKNREICLWAQHYGYLHIGWRQARYWRNNFDTNDWVPDPETPGYFTPQEILEKFNTLADMPPYGMNGAVILMHLGTERKMEDQQVHRVLGQIIDQLREKGYEFVPVSVLLKESGVDISILTQGLELG